MKRLKSKKIKAERFGKRGELWASLFLRLKFYQILQKNYKTPVGEIDIIAKKTNSIIFIEVKTRAEKTYLAQALEAVNKRRISKAANFYLTKNPHLADYNFRFDVIFLAPNALPYHIKGAFDNLE